MEGRFLDTKGRPVVIAVQLAVSRVDRGAPESPANWLPRAMFDIEGDGRFALRGIPAGLTLTLRTHAAFYKEATIEVRSGQRGVDVRLEPYDTQAYEALMKASAAVKTARAVPRPTEPAAAEAYDKRIQALEADHAAKLEHYVGHAGASCGGMGRGCG